MLKLLNLSIKLFLTIKKQQWNEALEINKEIEKVLLTYKDAC